MTMSEISFIWQEVSGGVSVKKNINNFPKDKAVDLRRSFSHLLRKPKDFVVLLKLNGKEGAFVCVAKGIGGRPGDYSSVWIYFPSEVALEGAQLGGIVEEVKRQLVKGDIDENKLEELALRVRVDNEKLAYSVREEIKSGKGNLLEVPYGRGTRYTLEKLLEQPYQKSYNQHEWVCFVDNENYKIQSPASYELKRLCKYELPKEEKGFRPTFILETKHLQGKIEVFEGTKIKVKWEKLGISRVKEYAASCDNVETVPQSGRLSGNDYNEKVMVRKDKDKVVYIDGQKIEGDSALLDLRKDSYKVEIRQEQTKTCNSISAVQEVLNRGTEVRSNLAKEKTISTYQTNRRQKVTPSVGSGEKKNKNKKRKKWLWVGGVLLLMMSISFGVGFYLGRNGEGDSIDDKNEVKDNSASNNQVQETTKKEQDKNVAESSGYKNEKISEEGEYKNDETNEINKKEVESNEKAKVSKGAYKNGVLEGQKDLDSIQNQLPPDKKNAQSSKKGESQSQSKGKGSSNGSGKKKDPTKGKGRKK